MTLSTTKSDTVPEADAAKYVGFTQSFLRAARRDGRGPAYLRVGRAVRYRLRDLDAWLDAHRVETRLSRRDVPATRRRTTAAKTDSPTPQ